MGDLPPTTNSNGGNSVKRLRSPINKNGGEVPPWVLVMIKIMQYKDCSIHSTDKLDRFCINCIGSFCNECSSNHEGHKHVKIRRYTLRDVINRPDFQKHFDCSGIQGYVTNKNKVLHLRERGDNQQTKGQQNTSYPSCIICNHTLTDAIYCSIQCKVSAMKTENTEVTTVDNKESKSEGEKLETAIDNAILEPEPSKKKKTRKGVPNRAPLI